MKEKNNDFDRNRFKTLIKGWIDEQSKINGKVYTQSKATNLQKTFSNKASKTKDEMVPNSKNNKPQSVLVHHLRF